MKCKVLYNILNNNSGLYYDIFFSIIIFLLFISIAFISLRLSKDIFKKILNVFFIIISFYMMVSSIYDLFSENYKIKNIYTMKEYKTIEGKVKNFKTTKLKVGYYIDSFEVNGIKFLYDSVTESKGLHKTKPEGSILKDRLYVKIKYIPMNKRYIKNLILYLEVCYLKNHDTFNLM